LDKATRTALEGSIAKWQAIVDGNGEDRGARNCPLCQAFLTNADGSLCTGCPVYKVTGRTSCSASPYAEWDDHLDEHESFPRRVRCPECKKLAQAELSFLQSLLPA